ncbi:MAG: ABC transporter permease [Anaerolineae bacterium]|nr:ABC transporter permease [Thermoflexales bacterium]MDW8407217.1 ABC transporter permease [Anaerolineae bacterium]
MDSDTRHSLKFVLLFVTVVLVVWESLVHLGDVPVYLLPAPTRILQALFDQPAYYLQALLVTLGEALGGLLVGASCGAGLAALVSLRPQIERGVMTLAILIKSTPLAAIAPLLTIWLGFGALPKIIITALLVFFPTLVNVLTGLNSVKPETLDLMRIHHATPWQALRHVRLWTALPYWFAALRITAPLALVGAVIAEWTGASDGLGRVMWLAYANLNLPPMFAAIFMLALSGVCAYGLAAWLERAVLRWNT